MIHAIRIHLGKVVGLSLGSLILSLVLALLSLLFLLSAFYLNLRGIKVYYGSHSKRHSYGIGGEIYVISEIIIVSMLLYLVCKDGNLSLLRLYNGLFSGRNISVCFILRVSEVRKLFTWLALFLRVVAGTVV